MHKLKTLKIALAVGILLPYFSIFAKPVSAADFEVHIQRTFTASTTSPHLHITETRTVRSNSSIYYIPASSKETFTIQNFKEGFEDSEKNLKQNSISVTNPTTGSTLNHTKELVNEDLIIKVNYPSDITRGQSLTFQLQYDTDELIEHVGMVTNIYIPGLEETYQKTTVDDATGTSTLITYETVLETPEEMGEATFSQPEPAKVTHTGGKIRYEYPTEGILGKTVWHQIGDEQTYHFKLTQPIAQTSAVGPDQLSFLTKNQYSLVLPREYAETNQKVFFSNLSPKPDEVKRDEDGNLIAVYYTDGTDSEEIVIEGYITVALNETVEGTDTTDSTADTIEDDAPHTANGVRTDAKLSDIAQNSEMNRYLQPAEYWESDAQDIINKANELAGDSDNIYEILTADYDFIVNSIDYDNFKYGDSNTRQGALATLQGSSSVCMEYSDLLIALARAQGIPARAAYGYGYDPIVAPDEQEDHQWVQVWLPHYGWLTIDPTWGETGRDFIGKDLDHALWYVASEHPNNPSPLEVTAAVIDFELEESTMEIVAVAEVPADTELQTTNELLDEIGEPQTTIEQVSRTIQTTILGRILVYMVPICGVAIVLVGGTTILIRLARKTHHKHKNKPLKATEMPGNSPKVSANSSTPQNPRSAQKPPAQPPTAQS